MEMQPSHFACSADILSAIASNCSVLSGFTWNSLISTKLFAIMPSSSQDIDLLLCLVSSSIILPNLPDRIHPAKSLHQPSVCDPQRELMALPSEKPGSTAFPVRDCICRKVYSLHQALPPARRKQPCFSRSCCLQNCKWSDEIHVISYCQYTCSLCHQ